MGIKNIFDYKDPLRYGEEDVLNSYDPGKRIFFEVNLKYTRS